MKKEMKKVLRFIIHNRKAIIKGVLTVVISIVAYQVAHKLGTAERGYEAVGGEIFIPFLVIFAKDIFKMFAEPFKAVKEIMGNAK